MSLNGFDPNKSGYGGSYQEQLDKEINEVTRVEVTGDQKNNPRVTVSNFDDDSNGNNKTPSKFKSKNAEPESKSNMTGNFFDNDGYDCVDSRLDSLDNNSCIINESLSVTVGNSRTESGYDFVDLKLQSLEDNTRAINDLNWDSNANINRKHVKEAGTHARDKYVVKEFLENRNSKNDLTSMGNDGKGEKNKAGMNDSTVLNVDNINETDDNANYNIRNRSSENSNGNDNRTYCDNVRADHTRSYTKYKACVEIATADGNIQNPNDIHKCPRKRKTDSNEKIFVKDETHENAKPDTYVRLQEAIQRSFTKFLYEIDLMEFSDSLYEQFVLDMNTYECLFEMWQLDKSKLDAKRKLLLYLSRGQINKEHFEKAVWKSSHYPLLDSFFPKT